MAKFQGCDQFLVVGFQVHDVVRITKTNTQTTDDLLYVEPDGAQGSLPPVEIQPEELYFGRNPGSFKQIYIAVKSHNRQ